MPDLVVGKRLGKGSFGDVFRAEWKGRAVAVKELRWCEFCASVHPCDDDDDVDDDDGDAHDHDHDAHDVIYVRVDGSLLCAKGCRTEKSRTVLPFRAGGSENAQQDKQAAKELAIDFTQEVDVLSRLRHPNLVEVCRCC